jgi:hypothetical protein
MNDVGNSAPVAANNESIYAAPWDMQVARGKVPYVTQVNVFGYGSGVGGTYIPLWEANTSYSVPTSAARMNVVSTSTSDDSNARILISGIDSTWNLMSELVTLNGTTVVQTANSFLRINAMSLTSPGTNQNTNIGTIFANNTSVVGRINPNTSRMQNGWYSVPRGSSLYIQNINVFSGETKNGNTPSWFFYRVLTANAITGVALTVLTTSFQQEYKVQRFNPVKYGQMTDVQWQFSCSDGGPHTLGLILEAVLIDNNAP